MMIWSMVKYKNTWRILENNGYYPSNGSDTRYSIEGDPEEHMTCIYENIV